jgi:hypothetical protein
MASDPNSVVDFLSSSGKASDFASRTALAKQYGINGYTGTAAQNTQLLGILKGGSTKPSSVPTTSPNSTPTTPSAVKDTAGANAYINGTQEQDYAAASKTNEPPIRTSMQTYKDSYTDLKDVIKSELPDAPEKINFEEKFNSLRGTYGVTDLETKLTDLQKQARDIEAAKQARTDAEKNKPVAMNVIEGRVSEEEQQENQRLTAVNNSIQTITDQLQTKYNVIENIMKYSTMDYNNAVDDYDKKFSQAISLMNSAKGIADTEKTNEEQAKDDARANLQIIYNNLSSGAMSVSDLTATDKTNISKLELQAGLPQGFYASLTNKNPKADILSTTTRDTGGIKYADVIMRNEDGSLTTKTIRLGAASSGSGSETSKDGYANINAIIDDPKATTKAGEPVTDQNGYITPAGFKQLVKYGSTVSISRSDLISQYIDKFYKDPENDYAAYGFTQAESNKINGY